MRLIRILLGIDGREQSTPGPLVETNYLINGERTAHRPARAGRNSALVFAKNFIAHPKMLGSIIPSSSFLIKRLLDKVDWVQARVIVEYGPGTGCITTEILKRLRKDGMLIAIDMNPEFVLHLRETVQDGRFRIYQGSAADVLAFLRKAGVPHADYIISGIPFSTIPKPACKDIMNGTFDALNDSGRMLVYQFSKAVLPHLKESFKSVETDFELLNILPARIFYCRK